MKYEKQKLFYNGENNPFYGKQHTEESKLKNRLAHLGKKNPKVSEALKINHKFRDKTYDEIFGIERAKEIKIKQSASSKGKPKSEKHKENLSKSLIQLWIQNPEFNKNFLNSKRMLGKQQSKFWREEVIKSIIKNLHKSPNKLEQKAIKLFKELPLRFTGDGSFIIGGKNPDFVENNGQKKVVEIRSKDVCRVFDKLTPEEYKQKRVGHFAKCGWKCLVVFVDYKKRRWVFEDNILEKIKVFLNG